jgi:predicted transcriptional regulator
MPDFGEVQKKVAYEILNNNLHTNGEISKTLNIPLLIITHIFEQFQSKHMIKFTQIYVGYDCKQIWEVSPLLRRWANT